jgi:hypothetical protein
MVSMFYKKSSSKQLAVARALLVALGILFQAILVKNQRDQIRTVEA